MKRIVVIVIVVLAFLLATAGYVYQRSQNKTLISKASESKAESDILIVKPQTPVDKVTIEKANLIKDSYLVVREVIDYQLGQIIEISSPLKKGIHNNIQIKLGSADVKGKDLIVMVYDDQNSDGVFNDFDQPFIDENGKMIARYLKTGNTIPDTLAEGEDTGAMKHNMAGMAKMVKVEYTDKGFTPEKITIPVGSMVEFRNDSNREMWVASAPHPSHTDLPTFDQFKPSKKGSVYRYVFDKKGNWGYHDHINAGFGGVVTVQ